MYSVRIACPRCRVQQTFCGTLPEIGDAVQVWNSKHHLTAHIEATGSVNDSLLLVSPASLGRRPQRPASPRPVWCPAGTSTRTSGRDAADLALSARNRRSGTGT
jgi:hypothetical protein